MVPDGQYARSGDINIAYTVFGEGASNLIWVPGFISQVEHWWEEPNQVRWLQRLSSFARVVMFDKRGTGLSDRFSEPPTMEERMEDVKAVMDAAGMGQAAVLAVASFGHFFFCAGDVMLGDGAGTRKRKKRLIALK